MTLQPNGRNCRKFEPVLRKSAGVNGLRSFGSPELAYKGRLFMKLSILHNAVSNSSSVGTYLDTPKYFNKANLAVDYFGSIGHQFKF